MGSVRFGNPERMNRLQTKSDVRENRELSSLRDGIINHENRALNGRLQRLIDQLVQGLEAIERDSASGLKDDKVGQQFRVCSFRETGDAPLASIAETLLRHRRQVGAEVDFNGLATSVAWDIMLDLYCARARSVQISVSAACYGAGCPQTTALRWVALLQEKGLIQRQPDETDKRRAWLTLTERGVSEIESNLASLRFSFCE